ncbi:MAG TPA: chain length determinant protein EpsF [Usitatibacter sp.]|nr:chain length determinant protein EpsF [Usitatibacter sp.]
MNIHQFLLALRGRFWVFLSLMAATIVAAIVVTLLLPKTYEATVSVLVDNRDEQSLAAAPAPARQALGYMQTQTDIIQSQRVARKVVEDLKLAENPQARSAFAASAGRGDIEDWLAAGLLARLKVEVSQSSVIQIQYAANDPKFAAAVANAFAKAYVDTTLNLRVEPTRQAASWFEDQLKELRKTYEEAQNKLADFQKEKGIIATDERVDVENARLAELSSQALQASNLTYDAAARLGQARSRTPTETLPEVLANPLVQTLKGEVLRGEARLQELATRIGPNHPQYQQQASEVEALRERLNAEMHKVVGGVESATAQSRAREGALKAELAAQRNKVIALRDARNQALVLTRDVDNAQKAYEAALARYLVNKVESGARQTNVTVLNPAIEPLSASRPKVSLNISLGLFVGIILGLAAVFLLELLDRRVRSSTDLESGIDAPLLGTMQTWEPARLLGSGGGATRALPNPA